MGIQKPSSLRAAPGFGQGGCPQSASSDLPCAAVCGHGTAGASLVGSAAPAVARKVASSCSCTAVCWGLTLGLLILHSQGHLPAPSTDQWCLKQHSLGHLQLPVLPVKPKHGSVCAGCQQQRPAQPLDPHPQQRKSLSVTSLPQVFICLLPELPLGRCKRRTMSNTQRGCAGVTAAARGTSISAAKWV